MGHMASRLSALVAGALFGMGLAISQMVDPDKVLSFLDIGAMPYGGWDPSLMLVLGAAVDMPRGIRINAVSPEVLEVSRQRYEVFTLTPGMPRASRTLAAAMMWASTVASSRSTQPRAWTRATASSSEGSCTTEPICS